METKIKKSCPNCSQFYQIKSATPAKSYIPLFLSCGHSMCESCITNIVKFEEPIDCKVCQQDTTISETDHALLKQNKIELYKLFPVNLLLVGEITMQMREEKTQVKKQEDNFYIDLNAIIRATDNTQAHCMECHQQTTKMCQQCNTNLCDVCFTKSHKNFVIFKDHLLANIEAATPLNNCKTHKGKSLDYYCKDCSKSACMDCLMVGGEKSCKNHNVVSMQEMNDGFLEELNDIAPKVNETFRRLTKTAVDVGHLLYNMENETGSSSKLTLMLANVEQNFSKLMASIQKHKQEVTDTIVKLQYSEKESLVKAKTDLAEAIKNAKLLINSINATTDPIKAKKANLSVLLEDAKHIVDTPWYLAQDKGNDPLKMTVNEDICSLVIDYIHLEGNASFVYKLRSTKELDPDVTLPPAPPAPVYPPELPKDVRQTQNTQQPRQPILLKNVPLFKNPPKYRSKSGSASSLNSQDSENSYNSSATLYAGDGFQRPMVQQVQPFAESQPPRPLQEGSQELIYITHIVDPHNFYVQRSCHQSIVKELIREFRNAASLPKPSINHVAEGKSYLVLNKADNMWQRCRVVSINRKKPTPTFLVFCVDFGSTENVTIEKLRLLPPARLQSPYPLAINCSLANCEPRTGTWTNDDAFLITEIIDNKQAVIHVRAVRSTAGLAVTLEVDVVTLEGGVSLAHALAFHERARMPRPKQTVPNILGIAEKPKIIIKTSDFKPRAEEEVYLTLVVSPDKFFVRKKHLQPVYEKLCEDLDHEYTALGNNGKVFLPEVGMSCVVQADKCRSHLAGYAWARALVHELPGRGRVRCFLPDSGILLLAHWSALRHIELKFTTLQALATECHLAGVTPLNKKWHPQSVALLQRYSERLLTMHVDDTRRGSVGVTLYDHSDPENIVCLNTEMIKHKFAVTFGIFNFNKTPVVEDQMYTNKSPLDKPTPKRKIEPAVTVLPRSKAPIKISESELEAKDKGPLRLEAKILHYQSPSVFYVSLVHQQKTFNELFEQIQKHYTSAKSTGKSAWCVGDRCCTLCAQSQTWRRAVLMEILPGDTAKVFFSDFACVETVPIVSLCELPPEFSTIGDAAIKCHLCGIVPADGGEEWPAITKEYLKELLDAYQRVFITKLGNFKNKSMPVELWVYHTIQGGALEPDVSEWRCLNRKIIEQGLAVPDNTHQNANEEPEDKDNDMLSFLKNVTSSVDQWLHLEPLPTKPLVVKPEPSPGTSPVADEDHDTLDMAEASGSSTVFISDWVPPEPLANKEFMAMPTYIDNDAVIYLHDLTQRDTLDLIRKALDVRFKGPDPKAKYTRWSVGEPCVAKFFLDSKFYRGRVMEVDNEDQKCFIHYVDYGNEELCSFEDLRKSIALYQIPIQAHKCALARIRPIEDKWDRQTLDYIHKSIVEKECLVKIRGDPINGIIPVDIKYDKLWINDHLVDFEMAEYTDGSKRVVPKFKAEKVVEVEPIVIESDSDPDYILANSSQDSYENMKNQDWNALMAEDEASQGKMAVFPTNELEKFLCKITVLTNVKILELTVIHDDETNLLYEEMYAKLQAQGENMPPLDGVFVNKACMALFHEDNMWYRTTILQYSEAENRVKLRYVDYGNTEIVSLADIREIPPECTELPPATIPAILYGIQVNPQLDINTLMDEYESTFVEKGPFVAKVIEFDDSLSLPCVELRNQDGELAYENLITKGVFIKCV